MKKSNKSKILWGSIITGSLILILLLIVSAIISLGEKLRKINVYVEYTFYAFAVLLVILLIIRPLIIIFLSPSFSIETTLEKHTLANYSTYKKVSKRLISSGVLSPETIDNLELSKKDPEELRLSLSRAYDTDVKPKINEIVQKHAETVFISTAISQNGKLDMLSVLVVNIRLIKEIVSLAGFRPNLKNISKLTFKVLTTALIAEGLENLDLNQIIPSQTGRIISELPLIKPILSSFMQGMSNCLLTLRIGLVCRNYLFSDAKLVTKNKIRKIALLEAMKILPLCVSNVVILFPKKVFSFLKPKKEKTSEDNLQTAE